LHNAANNLPHAFTDYNGVVKYWNHAVNAPERVEVPKKTTPAPSIKKKGKTKATRKDTLQRSNQERRSQKLLENPRM
jgi:hypothetical protein